MKYLLYWYTILMGEGKEWVQMAAHEIQERAYSVFTLKFYVSPTARRWVQWADSIFWGWRATRRNIGRVRCTRFFGGTIESIQGIFLRVWGDEGFKGIWFAFGSHWKWGCRKEESIEGSLLYILEICLFKLTRLWLTNFSFHHDDRLAASVKLELRRDDHDGSIVEIFWDAC